MLNYRKIPYTALLLTGIACLLILVDIIYNIDLLIKIANSLFIVSNTIFIFYFFFVRK